MAREVDRLLAQLADVGSQRGRSQESSGIAPTPRPVAKRGHPRVAPSTDATTRRDVAALWSRVLLGAALGGLMTQWPYPHACGRPLLGYLAAVGAVMLTGAWIELASWKLRSRAAHVLSLILFYWGIVLAAEQLLPRIGYAATRASWQCPPERAYITDTTRTAGPSARMTS